MAITLLEAMSALGLLAVVTSHVLTWTMLPRHAAHYHWCSAFVAKSTEEIESGMLA